jgi:glycine oxidase ThiO
MHSPLAVVGGGTVGLLSALRLAQAGQAVTLFERLQTGRESSWAAAGMLAPTCESIVHPPPTEPAARQAMRQALQQSRDLYPSLANELLETVGADIELSLHDAPTQDWRRPGIMYVSRSDSDPNLAPLEETGFSSEWPTGDAVWIQKEGQVESRKLVDALRKAAEAAGVRICENRTIRRLAVDGGVVRGLFDETGEFYAYDGVCICAGAWSGKIAGLPFTIPVRPVAGQIVALRADKRVKHVVYSDDCYLVPRRDGRLLVGATVEENGFNKRVTASGVSGLLTSALALVPELADAPLESHWCGLRPATPDGLPVIGQTPLENLWVATGHGRNGILLAPWTARLLTEMMLHGKPAPAAFSLDRFLHAVAR